MVPHISNLSGIIFYDNGLAFGLSLEFMFLAKPLIPIKYGLHTLVKTSTTFSFSEFAGELSWYGNSLLFTDSKESLLVPHDSQIVLVPVGGGKIIS